MDYNFEAKLIIGEYTDGYLQGIYAEYKSNREIMEDMYQECAYILTDHLIEGKYTPMQYAAIRNELGDVIWKIFESFVIAEENAEDEARAKSIIA